MKVELPDNYKPTSDEMYMGTLQLEYFRLKLIAMKEKIESQLRSVVDNLKNEVDDTDSREILASSVNWDRMKKSVDIALEKIETKEYGYCENTGEEIGIDRLEIEPTARYCIEEQIRIERRSAFLKEGNRDYDE